MRSAAHPAAVPVEHTLEWLDRALPQGTRRVLEVGCGRGALGAALLKRGMALTAIDADPDAVAAAKARGVPAVASDFLDYDSEPFAAVLMIRSLHHMGPLGPAIDRAARLVVPGGTLVLEEFAFERADDATAAWFYGERERLARTGRLQDDEAPEPGGDPLARWRAHHASHDVHEGTAMRVAVARRFRIFAQEEAPYLYRWFADRLTPDAEGARQASTLFELEREGIAAGRLQPIGLRIAARALLK